jgi:predicted lipoprotein with Yx(FWY)xxD motif
MPLQSPSMKNAPALLAACAFLLAACGDDDSGAGDAGMAGAGEERRVEATTAAEAPAAEPATPGRPGPLVKLRESQFGPVLFDGRDRALYLFTRDPRRQSRCYGACAAAWPPFYAKGKPRAARGIDKDLLGTVARRDGRHQVTYKGQPLYFYVDDPRGQVLCNDVVEFGGTWFALTAAGKPPAV